MLGLRTRDQSTRRVHDAPPWHTSPPRQEVAYGTRCARVARLGSHLAIGDNITWTEARQHRNDGVLEIGTRGGQDAAIANLRRSCMDPRTTIENPPPISANPPTARFRFIPVAASSGLSSVVPPIWPTCSVVLVG